MKTNQNHKKKNIFAVEKSIKNISVVRGRNKNIE